MPNALDDPVTLMQCELLKGYLKKLAESRSLAQEARASIRSRFVWFVGICGYVLFNAPPLWKLILGHEPLPKTVLWLSMPWVVTASLALLGSLLVDVYEGWDNVFYSTKSTAIDSMVIRAQLDGINESARDAVFNDMPPSIAHAKQKVRRCSSIGAMIGRAAVICMFLSFVSAVIGPRLLE